MIVRALADAVWHQAVEIVVANPNQRANWEPTGQTSGGQEVTARLQADLSMQTACASKTRPGAQMHWMPVASQRLAKTFLQRLPDRLRRWVWPLRRTKR
jgi:hypothetical protein